MRCVKCEYQHRWTHITCDLCTVPFTFKGDMPHFKTEIEFIKTFAGHLMLEHGLKPEQVEAAHIWHSSPGARPVIMCPTLHGGKLIAGTTWRPNPDYTPGQEFIRRRPGPE